jgi:hypothetical protein
MLIIELAGLLTIGSFGQGLAIPPRRDGQSSEQFGKFITTANDEGLILSGEDNTAHCANCDAKSSTLASLE